MKKALCILLCLAFLFLFCSCHQTIKFDGLDEFSPADSEYSLCQRLLPSESFIDDFDYIDGDYEYRDYYEYYMPFYAREHALMYLIYDESNYLLAKEYMLENIALSSINVFSYNGYQFYENLNSPANVDFPYWFNMIAYNDEKCTLMFLGLRVDNPKEADTEVLESGDMALILRTYFSCYNFDS